MAANIESILKLEVPVLVQIAQRTMPVEEVMSMAPGAIIELPKPADDDLEILVNNKPIGTGTAVKVGENFGVRVSYIGDLQQRITALANAPAAGQGNTTGADREEAGPGEVPTREQAAAEDAPGGGDPD
jgi:flagellar motor switch protein FliN/FliY